jgi:4-hydroxythreonine-4-phosphate dehydrogenase
MNPPANRHILPVIAITMGDPAGVGPEIVARALSGGHLQVYCRPLVIGDAGVLVKAIEMLRTRLVVRPISTVDEAHFQPGQVDLVDLANLQLSEMEIGKVSAASGRASVEYVFQAVQLAQDHQVDAIATAPINKEAINLGGYRYLGHTEILNELTHTKHSTTMLVAGELRVTHTTRHVPLRDVASLITRERVLDTIVATAEGLCQFGLHHPALGVATLNPHGGDGGLLGREEIDEIVPAVKEAQRMGIDALGPYPADSIFFRAIAGDFDAVVAMYHDQGHIPIKVHDFEGSYSVTLGLPIVRTSVDHGTAFDIAWQGHASPRSMIQAVQAAAELAQVARK